MGLLSATWQPLATLGNHAFSSFSGKTEGESRRRFEGAAESWLLGTVARGRARVAAGIDLSKFEHGIGGYTSDTRLASSRDAFAVVDVVDIEQRRAVVEDIRLYRHVSGPFGIG